MEEEGIKEKEREKETVKLFLKTSQKAERQSNRLFRSHGCPECVHYWNQSVGEETRKLAMSSKESFHDKFMNGTGIKHG